MNRTIRLTERILWCMHTHSRDFTSLYHLHFRYFNIKALKIFFCSQFAKNTNKTTRHNHSLKFELPVFSVCDGLLAVILLRAAILVVTQLFYVMLYICVIFRDHLDFSVCRLRSELERQYGIQVVYTPSYITSLFTALLTIAETD